MANEFMDTAEQAVDTMDQEFDENSSELFKGDMAYLHSSAIRFYDEIAEV